jgi:hypothetical protein
MKTPFCMAPFVHSHVTAWGSNSLCCVSDNSKIEKVYEADLDLDPLEFWNSDYMKNRRSMMMDNEAPPECHHCVKPHSHSVYRDTFFKVHFEANFVQKKAFLSDDFRLDSPPESLDYRNSVCNLQCQTCSSDSSTTLAQTWTKHASILSEHNIFFTNPKEPKERSRRTFSALDKIVAKGMIRHAYFAGGEPTLVPGHLDMIASMAALAPGKVRLSYNTNLMIKPQFVEKWLGLFNQFSVVHLYCSLDATEDLGSFIRMGIDMTQFEKNLNYIVNQKVPNLQVLIDTTITSLGLFRIVELAKFAISHNLKVNARIMVPSKGDFLLVEFLDKKTRRALCNKFRDFYNKLPANEQFLVENILSVMTIAEEAEEFTNTQVHAAMNIAAAYAKMYPDFPSFEEWLLKLKEENRSILAG